MWPVLALYAQNTGRFSPDVLWFPMTLSLICAAGTLLAARFATPSWTNAAVLASVVIVAFFGLWKPVLKDRLISLSPLPPWVFYLLYTLLVTLFALLLTVWLGRKKEEFTNGAIIATVISIVLVAFPLVRILTGSGATARTSTRVAPETLQLPPEAATVEPKRDVVLLILDGYGRADFLRRLFDFDNTPFLDALRDRGFFVATNSTSNYDVTSWSLPSLLNMDYLDALGVNGADDPALAALMRAHRALTLFVSLGYSTYAFPTGFKMSEPGGEIDHVIHSPFGFYELSEFEYTWAEFNPIAPLLRAIGYDFAHTAWRKQILFTLRNLHKPLQDSPGAPVYVRAHVVAPHWPFVFRADGGPMRTGLPFSLREKPGLFDAPSERTKLVVAQLQGLNHHLLETVDRILAVPGPDPIVLMVSDHATSTGQPEPRENLILCALHLPGKGQDIPRQVLDDLSLVNLFRVVFNTYFDADFPLLETKHIGAAEVLREQNAPPTER